MIKRICTLMIVGLVIWGCGDDSSETETVEGTVAAGEENSTETAGEESATEEVEETEETEETEGAEEAETGSGYCASNPATEANTLCASIQMPEDAAGLPEKVSFHFFASLPPEGPPTLMGLELMTETDLAPFEPGAEVPMMLENLPSEGELFLYAAIYMPEGGAQTWVLVSGVDYEGATDWETPITFTGEAINIVEPVQLLMAE